jgi:hypothetical protein
VQVTKKMHPFSAFLLKVALDEHASIYGRGETQRNLAGASPDKAS